MNPNVKGILLMAAAVLIFAVLDGLAKYVMQTLPPPVAVFFRYLIALLLAMGLIERTGRPAIIISRHIGLQFIRGLMLLASTVLNFIALTYLQLAQTAAISFTIPLWVCALSVPLLGEHVGIRRWLAVVVGFIGVLIIMRPGTMSFHWAMFLSLGATFCGSIYNIATRKVGGRDRAETSLFYVGLFGTLFAVLPLPWYWEMPQGIEWNLLLGMGLAGGVGHFLLIQAHRLAQASVLAPFIYTQIIWMILIGFIVFRDVPDMWTLIGAAIVVASGLFVFARERKSRDGTEVPAPVD
ncbi:DMT family transporter [Aestuariivirga sp.]|uniref:DMT family transporter n=1 Tax=Aestuariivirga sp. TaxID=2650926 RepID=UPI0035938265